MPAASLRLAALIALAALAVPARAQGALAGHVVDPNSGQAIVGATVSVLGTDLQATSDAYGLYRLEDVPGGAHAVAALSEGHLGTIAEAVSVVSGATRLLDFALKNARPDPADLRIRGGQPSMVYLVDGEFVSASLTYDLPSASAVGVIAGPAHRSRSHIPGYLLWPSAEFASHRIPVSSYAASNGVVTGHVSDPASGYAVAGATVAVDGMDLRATTDAFGVYRLEGVVARGDESAISLTASASGRTPTSIAVNARRGATRLVDFALAMHGERPDRHTQGLRALGEYVGGVPAESLGSAAAVGVLIGRAWTTRSPIAGYLLWPSAEASPAEPTGEISGYILDPVRGTPVAGAVVTVDQVMDGHTAAYAVTNGSGQYWLRALPAGSYTLTASALGYTDETVEAVEAVAGATRQVDFTLARSGVVDAVDLDAAPVEKVAHYVGGERMYPYTVTRPSGVAVGQAREEIIVGTIPARYNVTGSHWIMGTTGEDAADDETPDDE